VGANRCLEGKEEFVGPGEGIRGGGHRKACIVDFEKRGGDAHTAGEGEGARWQAEGDWHFLETTDNKSITKKEETNIDQEYLLLLL